MPRSLSVQLSSLLPLPVVAQVISLLSTLSSSSSSAPSSSSSSPSSSTPCRSINNSKTLSARVSSKHQPLPANSMSPYQLRPLASGSASSLPRWTTSSASRRTSTPTVVSVP
ncbi:hypothetical protein C8Q77DRAFT_1126067 [Trametes polyzona]|nr:hypothetical protein C8Q77DRAFT_1126067 [Trametes polyzona]